MPTPRCTRWCSDELERNPLCRPATYWSVVSARGAGDFDLAWNRRYRGLDSCRERTRRTPVASGSRSLRHANAHSRARPIAHGTEARLESHAKRNSGDDGRLEGRYREVESSDSYSRSLQPIRQSLCLVHRAFRQQQVVRIERCRGGRQESPRGVVIRPLSRVETAAIDGVELLFGPRE